MFCHSCGNEIPERAKFCPKCGAEVIEKRVEETVSNKDRNVYQGSPADGLTQATNRFKEKSRNGLLAALVVCAVVIAGVQLFGGGSSSSSSSSGSSSGVIRSLSARLIARSMAFSS